MTKRTKTSRRSRTRETEGERPQAAKAADALRLDPELRLASQFDATGIRKTPGAPWDRVGWQVLDDCCQDHIQ